MLNLVLRLRFFCSVTSCHLVDRHQATLLILTTMITIQQTWFFSLPFTEKFILQIWIWVLTVFNDQRLHSAVHSFQTVKTRKILNDKYIYFSHYYPADIATRCNCLFQKPVS
jgi:hypothetical protein